MRTEAAPNDCLLHEVFDGDCVADGELNCFTTQRVTNMSAITCCVAESFANDSLADSHEDRAHTTAPPAPCITYIHRAFRVSSYQATATLTRWRSQTLLPWVIM
jgi:hypothetical protein